MLLLPEGAGLARRLLLAFLLVAFSWALPAANLVNETVARVVLVFAVIGVVLVLFAPPALTRYVPTGVRILPSRRGLEAFVQRMNRVRFHTLKASGNGDEPHRAALRRTARWLYITEGLLSQANGTGRLSDEAIENEPADKPWGDRLYEQLGLPPEDEYR
jgi:hypothetical protein